MSAEIKPIRTTDVVLYEIVPTEDGHEWRPVARAGQRLTVGLRALDYLEVRSLAKVEDLEARLDKTLEYAIKSVQFGSDVLDATAIPYQHRATLSHVAFMRSVSGADPFFVAPAASQP